MEHYCHSKNIPIDSNLAWLLCALCMAMSWVIYITYYNSRVIGYILTRFLNHFIKQGYVKIGSLSISVLSGKIMFRDVAYITEDCTWRAQDGWIIFRWWYPYVHKEISEDLSHSDTRLSMLLNGFELHVYNRLSALFSIRTSFVPKYEWRDLIPVIKAEISTGRLVFGNRLLPTTLSVNFEEAHIIYTTKPASSRLDQFTHITKCKAENFKVILAPSPKYTGLSDEPPRYMGEGFVVSRFVTAEPEMVELADGDVVQRSTAPLWGLDIKCGKGTDFSYGPWADRQREHLYKFFFPQDFQTLEVTKQNKVGEKRYCESFDIRLSTLSEATIDILFSKEKETNAVHMNVGQGSYLEVTIPMRITDDGYISRINGQLLHLEASTSLQYRSLVESETLEVLNFHLMQVE
ncbi:transmembrane protein KIAA1109 [Caerostris extrusa]|uniref:Transmembrane protein KIAA1109 n=1 Tax=Caerostris extrusa TaxID=172846 RepID=A0AAV4T7G0_CAEEX|nr:transmembrane protein KIAA1109 [Caerostris extrusa]